MEIECEGNMEVGKVITVEDARAEAMVPTLMYIRTRAYRHGG